MSIIEYLIWQCDTSLHLLTLPPQYNKGLYCVTALQAPMKSGCVIGNSQVTHRSGSSKRLKTVMRPSRLQSRNKPIFLFRSNSNFDLKPFTVFADIVS